ncbi:MAG TPA: hypothetical protein GXZ74_01880 [Tissierellia bacterium]|nr:hypothetical protein [Tissierellia bacterium]
MEKTQLIQLMDTAISLDQELQDWMADKEAELAKAGRSLEEALPKEYAQRRADFEKSYQALASRARQDIDRELERIEAEKNEQLRANEQAFEAHKEQMITAVLDRIRGDELG